MVLIYHWSQVSAWFIFFVLNYRLQVSSLPQNLESQGSGGDCECNLKGGIELDGLSCLNKQLISIPNFERFDCTFDKLLVSGNSISHLTQHAFSKVPALKVVTLCRNEIDNVHKDAFANLQDLEKVDMSNNYLMSINSDTFVDNKNLKTISFAGNPLERLNYNQPFLNSLSVTNVNLSRCKLMNVNSVMFSKLPNLEELDLSSNSLQVIPGDTFTCKPSLKIVEIYNNLWKCDCDLQSLVTFVTSLRVADEPGTKQTILSRPVRCKEDGRMRTWSTFRVHEECPEPNKYETPRDIVQSTTSPDKQTSKFPVQRVSEANSANTNHLLDVGNESEDHQFLSDQAGDLEVKSKPIREMNVTTATKIPSMQDSKPESRLRRTESLEDVLKSETPEVTAVSSDSMEDGSSQTTSMLFTMSGNPRGISSRVDISPEGLIIDTNSLENTPEENLDIVLNYCIVIISTLMVLVMVVMIIFVITLMRRFIIARLNEEKNMNESEHAPTRPHSFDSSTPLISTSIPHQNNVPVMYSDELNIRPGSVDSNWHVYERVGC